MNERERQGPGSCVIVGEMQDEMICVRTGRGQVRRLWKDAPLHQGASFFDHVFEEMASKEPATVGSSFASLGTSLLQR